MRSLHNDSGRYGLAILPSISTMDEMGSFLIVGNVPAWVADMASARRPNGDYGAGPVDNVNSVL